MNEAPVVTDDYVRERLAEAVHALATADGPLAERLFAASLATATLHPRDFADEESRAEFSAIREMLTRHEGRENEGRVRATLARMSGGQARAVAERIFELDAHLRPPSPDAEAQAAVTDRTSIDPWRGVRRR